ncbi:hypothetical protein B0H10DRAFT_1806075 [Mycena sp. CBHHK59/15]|nr:hypothetical protein B0H10DRAFT_1806075 [Mycena sp. CBHHK59/15]
MIPSDIFDYIVVGGGTSGLLVASRVAEDQAIRVCVLEAGEDITAQLNFKRVGWGFKTSPQTNANNRSIYLPRWLKSFPHSNSY